MPHLPRSLAPRPTRLRGVAAPALLLAGLLTGLLLTATACSTEEAPETSKPSTSAPTSSSPAQGATGAAAGAAATMTAYLEASRDKDAEALCRVASTGQSPIREDQDLLDSCITMYGTLLGAAPDEEGYADVGVIVDEATRALAAGPSRADVEGDSATFVYDDLSDGKEITLTRHGDAWYVVFG